MTTGMKFDAGKAQWSLLPWAPVREVLRVLEFGAKKYAPNSWQMVPNARERYVDALVRHWFARFVDHETFDLESGLPHMAHLACNALFLLHFDLLDALHEQTQNVLASLRPAEPGLEVYWPVEPGYEGGFHRGVEPGECVAGAREEAPSASGRETLLEREMRLFAEGKS